MLLAIPDIESDRMFGVNTTAVALGDKRTTRLGAVLFLAMFCLLGLYMYASIIPVFVAAFVFPIGAVILAENARLLGRQEGVREGAYRRLSVEFSLLAVAFLIALLIARVSTFGL
jgi:4-hydroxybenzoate polyprenyltransferase